MPVEAPSKKEDRPHPREIVLASATAGSTNGKVGRMEENKTEISRKMVFLARCIPKQRQRAVTQGPGRSCVTKDLKDGKVALLRTPDEG